MVENKDSSIVTAENLVPVSRAVVILFPDSRTTDGVSLDTAEAFPDTLPGKFLSSTQRITGRYRQQGFTTFGVVYDDTTPELTSGLYDPSQFDYIIPTGITFADWTRDKYKLSLPNVIKALNLSPQASVIVGGYHAEDCVVEMASSLRRLRYSSNVDLRLTNELPFLLASHKARSLLGTDAPLSFRRQDRLIWEEKKKRVEELVQRILNN